MGGETFLLELIKQAPIVAALVYMVTLFLKHIRESDLAREALLSKRDAALQHLGDNCHAFQRDLAKRNEDTFAKIAEAMDRNTEALGANGAAIDRFHLTMDKVEGYVDGTKTVRKSGHNKGEPGADRG